GACSSCPSCSWGGSASRTSAPRGREERSPTTRPATRCACSASATHPSACCERCGGSRSSSCPTRTSAAASEAPSPSRTQPCRARCSPTRSRAWRRPGPSPCARATAPACSTLAAASSAAARACAPSTSRRCLRVPADAARGAPALPFPRAAEAGLADAQLRANLRLATRTIRGRRAAVVAELPDWEALRDAGAAIRDRALLGLDEALVELEESVRRAGGEVHWARDAAEANAVVTSIVAATGAGEVVKVKSLATDEIRLNEALVAAGIRPIETDLAELICQ